MTLSTLTEDRGLEKTTLTDGYNKGTEVCYEAKGIRVYKG